jgi:LysM repeat protein
MQQTLRELGGSILFATIAMGLVLGGISLALAEGFIPGISNPFQTPTQFPIPDTPSPTLQQMIEIPLAEASPSETLAPLPTSCPPPAGWLAISVSSSDTLASLATKYQTTSALLSQANCLASDTLLPNTLLYVPPAPVQTTRPCGAPAGWIIYIVQPGNTMYSLSHAYGVTISQLQQANCMSSGQTGLNAGQQFWVPNVITRTPLASATPTLTPVSIIFPTLTSSLTTSVPTTSETATSVPTQTTAAPTITQSPPPTTQVPTSPATATITPFP